MNPKIRHFMSKKPLTICHTQTLETAHEMMRQHAIRYLPVLSEGKLVGLLSSRDIHFIEALRKADPRNTKVNEVMSSDVYLTHPDTPLEEVASTMAEHKYGSTVVIDRGSVVGVFTTVDALKALAALLK
jgi:acetoin utilization protein AcuB